MTSPEWKSVHVAYFAEPKDDLIADAVAAMFERTAAVVARQYFTRHWRRGPHVRLNFEVDADSYPATVRPAVDDVIGGYLAARPSQAHVDPDASLPAHRRLAELEQEEGPLHPWYPDNSIQEAAYDDRSRALGGAVAADLLAEFYVTTTPLALTMTAAIDGGGSRLGTAFDLMLATAHVFARDSLASGFVSFRSHAEAFLGATPHGMELRQRWDAQFAQRADELTDRVRAVVSIVDAEGGGSPLHEWIALLRPINRRAGELVESGRLVLPSPRTAGTGAAIRPVVGELSPFHRALRDSAGWWTEVGSTDWFATYRVLLNYTYLQLTRLGVKPVERLLLCHLAADAVEAAYGVSALDRVSR